MFHGYLRFNRAEGVDLEKIRTMFLRPNTLDPAQIELSWTFHNTEGNFLGSDPDNRSTNRSDTISMQRKRLFRK
jgi:hypothetical protein